MATPGNTTSLYCRAVVSNIIIRVIYPFAPTMVCGGTVTKYWFNGIRVFNKEGQWHFAANRLRVANFICHDTKICSIKRDSQDLCFSRLAPMRACRWYKELPRDGSKAICKPSKFHRKPCLYKTLTNTLKSSYYLQHAGIGKKLVTAFAVIKRDLY